MTLDSTPEHAALVAAPRMKASTAAAYSSASFNTPADDKALGFIQPKGPHRFVLRDDEVGFETPAGLFSVVEVRRGVIFRVRTTPHLKHLERDEAVALCYRLEAEMLDAGWKPLLPLDKDTLLAEMAQHRELVAGQWGAGELAAEIRIKRVIDEGNLQAEVLGMTADGFLVTLMIWDESLHP